MIINRSDRTKLSGKFSFGKSYLALAALIALSSLGGAACSSAGNASQSNQEIAQVSSPANSNSPVPEQSPEAEPVPLPETKPAAPQLPEQPAAADVKQAPKAGSSLPASGESRVDGEWQSPIGRIVLKQNGTTVTGTVHYKDGSGTGAIKGKMVGKKLTFTARDNSGRTSHSATGEARFSKDGRRLIGTVRVEALGLEQPFVLTK
jgi:hypothetical protein